MSARTQYLAVILTAALAVTGCRRTRVEPPEAAADRRMRELQSRVAEFIAQGVTNSAILALEAALWNDDIAVHRAGILRGALGFRLESGDADGARQLFLSVVERDPHTAQQAFGVIEFYLIRDDDGAALAAWCEELLSREALGGLRERLWGLLIETHRKAADGEALLGAYERCLAGLPEDAALRVTGASFDGMLDAGQSDMLRAALDLIEKRRGTVPGFAGAIVLARVRLALKEERLDEAADLATAAAGRIGDGDQAAALDLTARAAGDAGRRDLIDRMCGGAVEAHPAASRSFEVAARRWVDAAVAAGELDAARERVASLLQRAPPVSLPLDILQAFVYPALEKGTPEGRRAMLELCDALRATSERPYDRMQAATLTLDACFMNADFDKALAVLRDGIPQRNEAWHRMLIIKVKAHKALNDGRVEDAIGLFREFMNEAAASDDELMDPTTKERVPLGAVLGLNAARIGDLWKSIGRLEEARAAYDEARAHYRGALEKLTPGTEQHGAVRREMEAVPGQPAGPSGGESGK